MTHPPPPPPPPPDPGHESDHAAAAAADSASPKTQNVQPASDAPASRFLASMTITYEKWHDGIGYDLDAIRAASSSELRAIELALIEHRPRDWRDVEALAQIDTPTARAAVERALRDPDPAVRREAMRHAADKLDPSDRERLLLKSLARASSFDGLIEVLDEVEEFHPPSVIDALLRRTLDGDGETAVHYAAMLMFLHGKSAEPFDWNHRPFFLRFNTTDRAERVAAFRELCERIGVDAGRYLGSSTA